LHELNPYDFVALRHGGEDEAAPDGGKKNISQSRVRVGAGSVRVLGRKRRGINKLILPSIPRA